MKSANIFSPDHCLVCPTYKILRKVDDLTNANVGGILLHLTDIKACGNMSTIFPTKIQHKGITPFFCPPLFCGNNTPQFCKTTKCNPLNNKIIIIFVEDSDLRLHHYKGV